MNPGASRQIRVGVLHSEPLVAAGIQHSLNSEAGIQALPIHHDGWRSADVVVADLASGMRLAVDLKADPRRPATHLLILASNDKEFDVRRALESGVHGYLLSSCDASELVHGVRTVSRGSRYVGATIARRIAESLSHEVLTLREHDVLELIARGQCNKTIASNLAISVGTVKAHVKSIFAKLNARSRTHAALLAVERGIVSQHV